MSWTKADFGSAVEPLTQLAVPIKTVALLPGLYHHALYLGTGKDILRALETHKIDISSKREMCGRAGRWMPLRSFLTEYSDQKLVVEWNGENGEVATKENARIRLNPLVCLFELYGSTSFDSRPNPRLRSDREIYQTIVDRLGDTSYHLATNNCEHFVSECLCGRRTSAQVSLVTGLALLGALLIGGATVATAVAVDVAKGRGKSSKEKTAGEITM